MAAPSFARTRTLPKPECEQWTVDYVRGYVYQEAERRRRRHRLDPDLYRADGLVFSITVCTGSRVAVFLDAALARDCRDLLLAEIRAGGIPLYAYCLMPDHAHLVIGASPTTSVVELVQRWKSLCYRAGRRRGLQRSFWQRGFWDHALRSDEDLLVHSLYVLHNPVRVGLVSAWREYPWSGSEMFQFDA